MSHVWVVLHASKDVTLSLKVSNPQIHLVLQQQSHFQVDINPSKLNCPSANTNQLQKS